MTQNKALKILKSGANVFLTGQPGCGKTYTINRFVVECEKERVYPAITASTGIAATHIEGITIHSWCGMGDLIHDLNQGKPISDYQIDEIAEKKWIYWRIMKTQVLVIDEVSMLSGTVLDIIDRICRAVRGQHAPFGGIQIVLVGDMFQLPPVSNMPGAIDFVYKSKVWDELNLKICNIHEQHRQKDKIYLDILTSMRKGEFKKEHLDHLKSRLNIKEKPDATRLFTHNGDVDYLNIGELGKIPKESHTYTMTDWGNENLVKILKRNCLSPEKLTLKEGALVMFTRNSPEQGFVNGTLGKVVGFNARKRPIVRITNLIGEDEDVEPGYMDWSVKENKEVIAYIKQVPLKLAWAITVHKSQGMSLDRATIDLSRSFEYGQGYVALSRVRSLEGLFLEGLNDKALLMHPEIVEKDKEFQKLSLLLEDEYGE